MSSALASTVFPIVLSAVDVNGFDQAVLHVLNCDVHGPVIERVLAVLQDKWFSVPVFLGLLLVLCFLDRRRVLRVLGAAALGWGLAMLLASAFWVGIERPRPPWVYERVLESKAQDETTLETCATVPDTLIVRRHKAGSPSFPSRHALTAGVLAMALTLAWRWVGLAAWLYALLVAIGRVHSGVHWPTDVIAGLAIGALVAWGTWRVTPRILRRVGLGRLTEIEEPREAHGGADGSGPDDDSAEPGGAGAPLG